MTVKNKSILFLSHVSDLSGGAEKSLVNIVEDTINNGFNAVVIVPSKGSVGELVENMGGIVEIIPANLWAHVDIASSRPNEHMSSIARTIGVIEKHDPICCVTNSIVNPSLAYAAAILRKKHIWVLREFGSLDHRLQYDISEEDVYKTIDNLSDIVLVNSQATKAYFSKKLPKQSNIDIVFPYIATAEPDADFVNPYVSNKFKIVIVGQIKPPKGQLDIIKAIANLKKLDYDVQLCVVGGVEDKTYEQMLNEYIKTNHLEKDVLFEGYQRNPFNYLKIADVSIVASPNEAFGRVTIESMMSNTPVIGARGQGTSLLIKDNDTGLLYTPGNDKDLTDKIVTLIDKPEIKHKLTRNAKTYVDENHSREKSHRAFFNSLVKLSTTEGSSTSNLFVFKELYKWHVNITDMQSQNNLLQSRLEMSELRLVDILESKSWKIITKCRQIKDFFKPSNRSAK